MNRSLDIAGNGIGVAGAQALLDEAATLTLALTMTLTRNPKPKPKPNQTQTQIQTQTQTLALTLALTLAVTPQPGAAGHPHQLSSAAACTPGEPSNHPRGARAQSKGQSQALCEAGRGRGGLR